MPNSFFNYSKHILLTLAFTESRLQERRLQTFFKKLFSLLSPISRPKQDINGKSRQLKLTDM